MEKTKITDVRKGFDFLGYRVAQEKLRSTGRRVGMLFIPKNKSQLLRDKVKAKVRGTPTGFTLVDLIGDLNPVIIGWRNYYRYASRAWRSSPERSLYWRLRSWLGKKHSTASRRKLRRVYNESGGKSSGWRLGERSSPGLLMPTAALSASGLRIPNGWNATPSSVKTLD
ncbi:group II intron maturase-specific domain-containing protein [Bradyrhizobium sp. SRL28]|uniref:group II intron maturase-specific domain-containing protein n=1 Tax=Bradyrhizobium sp. SRL28 TaxID=2836178 RepID=UPI00201C1EFA|nr:group II intron maturase-specific domain-containing protein [Bradyrhizobium sp. SRL28]